MPVSDLHRQVAAVALAAAREHGFALGGGNALLAHGVISRPTQDVDLFTDQEHGVPAAAGVVEAALRGAGFEVERLDQAGGLSDMFPDIGEGLAEWIVTAAGGEQMLLQLAYFERGRDPVVMDLGPVLDLEDAVGGKVSALVPASQPGRAAGLRGRARGDGPLQHGPADRLGAAAGSGSDRRGLRLCRAAAGPDGRPAGASASPPAGRGSCHPARSVQIIARDFTPRERSGCGRRGGQGGSVPASAIRPVSWQRAASVARPPRARPGQRCRSGGLADRRARRT